MGANITTIFFKQTILFFIGLPLLIWAMGSFPERTLLKETLSLITILALFQMIGQFFWARTNTSAVAGLKMGKIIKYHKIIGYTFVSLLLLHPVFLFVPRFFEAGIDPVEAFVTTITTFSSQGIVLGIIAWVLLLILGITSFARKQLPMKYNTWRIFHGVLSILCIIVAAWHAIDLGRHSDFAMSFLIIFTGVGGILLVVKAYAFKLIKKTGEI